MLCFRFGSHELKERFLVPSIKGDMVSCLGVSEVGAGSDVASEFVLYALKQENKNENVKMEQRLSRTMLSSFPVETKCI